MFTNDDICNLKAAKSAARRIFQRYTVPTQKQSPSSGLGQEEVSSLIKNAYSAINISYDPSSNDVSSFMSVFGVSENGRIDLSKIQELAVKYLCGQDALKQKVINNISGTNQQSESILKEKTQQLEQKKQIIKTESKEMQKKEISLNNDEKRSPRLVVKGYQFYSPRGGDSKKLFSSKQFKHQRQPQLRTSNKLKHSQIISTAYEIFHQNIDKQILGITKKQAPQLLSITYKLIGKSNYCPSQEDVKIWMQQYDTKNNGVVEWASYECFVKKMMEKDSITESE